MDILDVFPSYLKQKILDGIVNIVAQQAEKIPDGDKIVKVIRQFSSQAAFYDAFDQAMVSALERFRNEYNTRDEDLVVAITTDTDLWQSESVRHALMVMIQRPGSWIIEERETVAQHFADVLQERINRERVDKAVTFFLRCVVEDLWNMPGVSEIREIYNLQFQKISAEAARQQVALLEAQLQATTQLSTDLRQALLQLTTSFEQHLQDTSEQHLQVTSPLQITSPAALPYHNLPQPDYTRFVGRQKELDWLRMRLSPSDRAWQIAIVGIGGVGKTALALAIAHHYLEYYPNMPSEERFEAIIWFSAKEEVLTIKGREKSALSGLLFRTLEDMYTTIAQALNREDITRALPHERDQLVRKALSAQRTLLIIDNMETVSDERVRTFLRYLPVPTKCINTSREWLDVADVLKLIGLSPEEAEHLITEEATVRNVNLNEMQIGRLFERTSGLPLPIKLSAARLASGENFDQVIRWLGDARGDLAEYCIKGQIDTAHLHDTNSWKILLTCSLFDQDIGATREALGSIADLSLAERDEGLTLLQRLSLLNRTEADRFWMLPMVRECAEAELAKADFGEVFIERWLDWLIAFTQNYGIDLEFHIEHAREISSVYPHLLNAIRWCLEHQRWETLLQLVEGSCFYPYLVGLFGELREMLEAGMQATKSTLSERNERCEGRFMYQLARTLRVQGQFEEALEYLDKAEEIALRYKDDLELGRLRQLRAHILYQEDHLLEGEQVAKTVKELGDRLNNLELKVWAYQRLAHFESKKLHFDKAEEWLDQAEKWCKELNWSRELAWTTADRTSILMQQGNITAAETLLMESLKMATYCSDSRLIARNKYRLVEIYLDTTRLQRALQMAEEVHDLYERLGMAKELANVKDLLQRLTENDAHL